MDFRSRRILEGPQENDARSIFHGTPGPTRKDLAKGSFKFGSNSISKPFETRCISFFLPSGRQDLGRVLTT